MPIHQVLRLGRGAIIELDASEEDEVRILANNLPVAKGTVIVSGNKIAVEVKQLMPRTPVGYLIHYAFAETSGLNLQACRSCPPGPSCYIDPRALNLTRGHPTCGRGGIGRRTSLRC